MKGSCQTDSASHIFMAGKIDAKFGLKIDMAERSLRLGRWNDAANPKWRRYRPDWGRLQIHVLEYGGSR